MRTSWVAGATALFLAASCGGSTDEGTRVEPERIEIAATDKIRFAPETVTIYAGLPVVFVVTNEGSTPHELVVHGAGGHAGGHGDASVSLQLAPGDTKEATVTFDEAGSLEYACHVDNHYEIGMKGTLTVQ